MTLKPPHMTMTARATFTRAREKSQRLRTVGLPYVPSAGVRVTKFSELSPKPSAQSTKPRIASSSAWPITVRRALRMSPAHLRGSRLLNQSMGLGMPGSCGSTWGSVPGGCGTDSAAAAAAGPGGGEPIEEEGAGDVAAGGATDDEVAAVAGAARGAPAKTSSASASSLVVSGPPACTGEIASAPAMRATATVAPTSRTRMAPPFRRLPPAPSRVVYEAVLGASVTPASPTELQESSPISPIWGAHLLFQSNKRLSPVDSALGTRSTLRN